MQRFLELKRGSGSILEELSWAYLTRDADGNRVYIRDFKRLYKTIILRKEVAMSSKRATILVVDDEHTVAELLSEDLAEEGYNCITVATGEDALVRLSRADTDVMLLDIKLPGISGMDVLREVSLAHPTTATIVVTAVVDAQTAVEAMKSGAVDYITKPFELGRIHDSVETALQKTLAAGKKLARARDSTKANDDKGDWLAHLDDIARGVEIRLESLTGHTITVIEETIAIARSLGIPEDQINEWANARRKQNTEKINGMNSLLKKLEQNPIAQIVMGMTDLHQCPPSYDSHLN